MNSDAKLLMPMLIRNANGSHNRQSTSDPPTNCGPFVDEILRKQTDAIPRFRSLLLRIRLQMRISNHNPRMDADSKFDDPHISDADADYISDVDL